MAGDGRRSARALAQAIAQGTPVDWAEAEASADDEAARAIVRQLRVIAGVTELHRRVPFEPVDPSRPLRSAGALQESRPEEGAPAGRAGTAGEALGSWGPLTLLERVGRGSFGEVYRAWDPRLDREVALKVIERPGWANGRHASVAVEEGRLLARVRHPNVVTVYGADRLGESVGVWTEFVHGQTLAQLVSEHGPFDVGDATAIGVDLCGALAAVHQAGLIHRDVKAQNVMREDGGRIVLMDFGTGIDLDEAARAEQPGAGTPLYMAPEIMEGHAPTPRADLYSVGVLLYHLVSGTYPVSGRTVDAVRAAHRSGARTPLGDGRPGLPAPFVRVLERALAHDPAIRYESAAEMESALAAVQAERAAAPKGLPTMAAAGPWPRRWMVLALAAAAVMLVSTAIAYRVLQGRWPGSSTVAFPSGGTGTGAAAGIVLRQVAVDETQIDTSGGAPSPDGRFISGVDWSTGDLAILDLDTSAVRRLTSGANGSDEYHAFSSSPAPDNRHVAYVWAKEGAFLDVRITDRSGAAPRTLVREAAASAVQLGNWSADGAWIVALISGRDNTTRLSLVATADGSWRVLESFTGRAPGWASLSPDGRFVAYDLRVDDAPAHRDIFVRPVDEGSARPLVEHPADDRAPIWTPDAAAVLFVSDRAGTTGLWRIPVQGGAATGPAEVVQKNMGHMSPMGLTSAGALYYAVQTGMVDVYTATLDIPAAVVVTPPAPVRPRFVGSTMSADWSADGRFLAFTSAVGESRRAAGSRAVVVLDAEGGGTREIEPAMGFFVAPRWTRDSTAIVLKGADTGEIWGAHAVNARTGAMMRTVLVGTFGPYEWFGDGGAIVYAQGSRVLMLDRPAGRPRTLRTFDTRTRITDLAVETGGSRLAVSTFDGSSTWAVVALSDDRAAPREILRVTAPEFLDVQAWVGDEILFTKGVLPADLTRDRELWAVGVDGGGSRPLGLKMQGLRELRVHPDRRRVAFTSGAPTWEVRAMEHFLPRTAR